MAKLYFARNSHPFLRHGYEVLDNLEIETRFCTYQFYPRAEDLVREAALGEGSSIPRPTFYAWLLDADIYNEARQDGINISSVPQYVIDGAKSVFSFEPLLALLDGRMHPKGKYTLDY